MILAWLVSRHRTRNLDVERGLMLPSQLYFRGKGNSSHTALLLLEQEPDKPEVSANCFFFPLQRRYDPAGIDSRAQPREKSTTASMLHRNVNIQAHASEPAKRSSYQVDTDRDVSSASMEEAAHLPTAR